MIVRQIPFSYYLAATGLLIASIGISLGALAAVSSNGHSLPPVQAADWKDDNKAVEQAEKIMDRAISSIKQSADSSMALYFAVITVLGLVSYETGMCMVALRYRPRRLAQIIAFLLLIVPLAWFGAKLAWHQRERHAITEIEAMGGGANYSADFTTLFSNFVLSGRLSSYNNVGVVFLDTSLSPMKLKRLRTVLGAFSTLHDLSLSGSTVDDSWLEQLHDLSSVEQLNLEGTNVTDNGIRLLKGWSGLRVLHLDGSSRITGASVEYLKFLPNLLHLGIGRTHITDVAAEQLHKMKPEIEIAK